MADTHEKLRESIEIDHTAHDVKVKTDEELLACRLMEIGNEIEKIMERLTNVELIIDKLLVLL